MLLSLLHLPMYRTEVCVCVCVLSVQVVCVCGVCITIVLCIMIMTSRAIGRRSNWIRHVIQYVHMCCKHVFSEL